MLCDNGSDLFELLMAALCQYSSLDPAQVKMHDGLNKEGYYARDRAFGPQNPEYDLSGFVMSSATWPNACDS